MDADNRNLIILSIVAVLLVIAAAGLTYAKMTREPPPVYPEKSDDVMRIIKVTPEITRSGGHDLVVEGPLKVELKDKRNINAKTAPKHVTLKCETWKSQRPFPRQGRDKFSAEFPDVPHSDATCTLEIAGARDPYEPVYPGDELVCFVDDELRTRCEGGAARLQGAIVTVRANAAANLQVDGDLVGPLPQENSRMKIGRRTMQIQMPDGRVVQSILVLRAEETVDVHFTLPTD